jgi:hypothetical protein
MLRGEDVAHAGSAGRKSRSTDEAAEEAEDQDGRHVLGEDLGDLENDEECEADDVDRVTPDFRELLNRREDHCE